MAPPRYPANPHRVTLNLDPITSDALTQAAKTQKCTRDRLAYELVQRGLGIGVTVASPAAPAVAEPDSFDRAIQRGLAAITNLPKGQ